MKWLKNFIENDNTKAGRYFDIFIQILIVISLVTFAFETLPDLDKGERKFLRILETVIVVVFTVEYVLRIIVSDNKLKFIFSFYGLIDLIAILPFYISTGIDLRSVRVFRMLRLFRILKIVKYTKAIDRYKVAFKEIRTELSLFFMVTVIMLYVAGVGFYYFENKAQPELVQSVFDGLWWAVITLTTVGYGDVYPITLGGKFFTFIILMIGLGIVAVPAGLLASALSKNKNS
jgi:voltage-gated potassium channel